jgi:hypothetical protein
MLTDVELKKHNLKFHRECARVRAWLAEQLRSKDAVSTVVEHKVFTSKKEGRHEVGASIDILPDFKHFSHEAQAIKVIVKRRKHSITYRRGFDDWKNFPWDKIIATHLQEVDRLLQADKDYTAEHEKTRNMARLADQEVPTPKDKFGNPQVYSQWTRFSRRRAEDGTYTIHAVGCNFTAEEARAIRDIAIAAYNRSEAEPIAVPKNEKTTKPEETVQGA